MALTEANNQRIALAFGGHQFQAGVLAGQSSFYSNNIINAVFANRSTATRT